MKRGNAGKRNRFRNTLTSRYLIIILAALIFMPIVYPTAAILHSAWVEFYSNLQEDSVYSNAEKLEEMWHLEAAQLKGADAEQVNDKLAVLKSDFPEISLFWVDGEGRTRLKLPEEQEVPKAWSAETAVSFMKKSVSGDPFTVIAFIGGREDTGQGFMVMTIPRKQMVMKSAPGSELAVYLIFMGTMSLLFIFVSWLFFAKIRKRLLSLRDAMNRPGAQGVPIPVQLNKRDEIGQLEEAYNHMVDELVESRKRKLEEEELRKSLIASLSHDLRTPLTVIRSHIFSLEEEELTPRGKKSAALIGDKIGDLSGLIDNLLTYSLLTSGRVTFHPQPLDVLRLVRESAAAWYTVWEKEGLSVEINLDENSIIWHVDDQWFRRVLDNLFQNVVRHARSGGYIGIEIEDLPGGGRALVISDRGPGMNTASANKGAGIGLSVVDFLTRDMGLQWKADSSPEGTRMIIYQRESANRAGAKDLN